MSTDARIETDPPDDGRSIQAMYLGVGIQLVEIADPHRQIGVGEQLDRLCFGGMADEDGDVFLQGAFL